MLSVCVIRVCVCVQSVFFAFVGPHTRHLVDKNEVNESNPKEHPIYVLLLSMNLTSTFSPFFLSVSSVSSVFALSLSLTLFLPRFPNLKVHVTGHSLGAALSGHCTFDLAKNPVPNTNQTYIPSVPSVPSSILAGSSLDSSSSPPPPCASTGTCKGWLGQLVNFGMMRIGNRNFTDEFKRVVNDPVTGAGMRTFRMVGNADLAVNQVRETKRQREKRQRDRETEKERKKRERGRYLCMV